MHLLGASGFGKRRNVARCFSRIPHYLLQNCEIVQKAAPPLCRDPANRLWAIVVIALEDIDQPGLQQHLQMAAKVTVGESAQALEIGEN